MAAVTGRVPASKVCSLCARMLIPRAIASGGDTADNISNNTVHEKITRLMLSSMCAVIPMQNHVALTGAIPYLPHYELT